jgi:hypothetical protein
MHHWALCNRVFPYISPVIPDITTPFILFPLCFGYNITPFYLLSSYVLLSQFEAFSILHPLGRCSSTEIHGCETHDRVRIDPVRVGGEWDMSIPRFTSTTVTDLCAYIPGRSSNHSSYNCALRVMSRWTLQHSSALTSACNCTTHMHARR